MNKKLNQIQNFAQRPSKAQQNMFTFSLISRFRADQQVETIEKKRHELRFDSLCTAFPTTPGPFEPSKTVCVCSSKFLVVRRAHTQRQHPGNAVWRKLAHCLRIAGIRSCVFKSSNFKYILSLLLLSSRSCCTQWAHQHTGRDYLLWILLGKHCLVPTLGGWLSY